MPTIWLTQSSMIPHSVVETRTVVAVVLVPETETATGVTG